MDVSKLIADKNAEWNAMIGRREIDGIIALYDGDAAFMVPRQPAFAGSEAIRLAWAHLFGLPNFGLTITPNRTTQLSDSLYLDKGSYNLSFGEGEARHDELGKYLVIWRFDGEDAVIIEDIFNADH